MTGQRVTLLAGAPGDVDYVTTVGQPRSGDGALTVRFESGATLIVDPRFVVPGWLRIGPGARNTDPETSHLAAVRDSLRDHQRRVLRALYEHEAGLLDHAYPDLPDVNLGQDSAGKRRGELVALGLVADSGRKGRTPRGKQAIVWQITAAGRIIHEQTKGT
jgi:hypothetical protein